MAAAGGGQLTGSEVREIAPGIWCWQRRPGAIMVSLARHSPVPLVIVP